MKYDKNNALLESSIPELQPPTRGKVRDVYDLGDSLLFVATDRISAFDCVMPNGIPDKGRVLTQLSLFWFEFFSGIPNHLSNAIVAKSTMKALNQTGYGLSACGHAQAGGRVSVPLKSDFLSIGAISAWRRCVCSTPTGSTTALRG